MDRSLAGRPPFGRLNRPATTRPRRAPRSAARPRRRLRLALIAALIAAPLLAGGWLWLKHSPLVAVQSVKISGVHGPDAAAIDVALTDAARHMTTLDVRPGALRAAVAPFLVVREVQATAQFPHG